MLCNCDDPYESNFFQYFALNYGILGARDGPRSRLRCQEHQSSHPSRSSD
ncbi:MAG: adenine-specific methyltransferase EcoRI family protein [Armatimonadota bacterium]|nr:adenine-specific methyltransferase EcoRI family protein [Armatimonadota bacterium]